MSKILIFAGTLLLSFVLAVGLISALPGHYHHDEVKIQGTAKPLDWTKSWEYPDRSLFSLVAQKLRYTMSLQLISFAVVFLISFLLCLAALRWPFCERVLRFLLSIGTASPSLFIIPLMVYFLSLKVDLFPLRFEEHLAGWVLPVLALAIRPLCVSTEILLLSWKESMTQNYFLVARSKGLSKFEALYKHGLKNALVPYSTQIGAFFVQSLMGSVLVETLFSFPGIGQLFVQSLQSRDLPVVLVLTILFTMLMMIVNSAVEAFHSWVEPRRGVSL